MGRTGFGWPGIGTWEYGDEASGSIKKAGYSFTS
jgi:hypothetical protein